MRRAVTFVALYLLAQTAALAYGQSTPDHVLGFRMFNESSRLSISLFREVSRKQRRVLLAIPDGSWQAPDERGVLQRFSWHDRVRDRTLAVLGRPVNASYGLDAQLFRLQAALEDVVRHIPHDRRTTALVAVVHAEQNGKPAVELRLRAERP